MEYNINRIGNLIKETEKYLGELKSYNIKSKEDLTDSKTFHAASMVVFAILNRIIDLGNDILISENVGAPNSYQDIMPLLAKSNVINREQASELNLLVKKRNVFAHFYGEITMADLLSTIKKIYLVNDFLSAIRRRVY